MDADLLLRLRHPEEWLDQNIVVVVVDVRVGVVDDVVLDVPEKELPPSRLSDKAASLFRVGLAERLP